ncbi:flagellar filament capping protein FliD [Piscinibacter terrae]|uniref:Flagellar hook-associated protein 2 n=1 Tax=Piscinibacter terrae TaxID=2496871 RepID=A0A3N7J2S8_9BURK|nr:flagellar filament capping protein FliD [Albitalea terrae]RQP25242.1 flagellar hook protein [Albitalea terrae]
MATLSSPGIGSGLDVNSIVTQLVALERKPIDDLKSAASTIQTKLSSFGLLSSYTSNLRDISDKLTQASFWTGTAANSSDASAVAVSSTNTATAANYLVNVTSLARAQSLASATPFATSTSTVGTGNLHIELGSWDDGLTTFTPDASKVAVDVAIDAGSNTLDGIKTKINAANAGVTASIVNDASGAKLVLTSTSTGAKSAVRITATDDDGNNTDAAGLSALAFNPPVSSGQMSQTQGAKNAAATVNGLPVTSATNTLDGVISGVTLTLGKETTSPVQVNVSRDTASIKKAITDFAKAYSDMNGYITTQTKYDATTKKAAALQGDRSTLTVQSNLRRLFTDNSSASLVYSRLSDVGLEIQTDGTMKVNDAKLSAALASNPAEVSKLFMSTTSADPNEQGFAVRAKALATQLIGSGGAITTRTQSLRDSVTRNQKQQDDMEARVALTQARLTKQYGSLDTTLSKINATNSSLTQSLKALAAQTSSGN